MDYEEACGYVKGAAKTGIRPGLDRIRLLLHRLGDPQDLKPVIHVAGTNGKGSVCTYIASIMREAGYSAGRYISPSVFGYREMIQIDGRWISEEDTAQCLTVIRDTVESDPALSEDMPTSFEIETAMAFLYLGRSRADVLVIETGMGGRLDATNVVDAPLITVITPVAMDHMKYLGSDIASIAAEKGGIIKPGRPAVICGDNSAAADVLAAICRDRHSDLHIVSSRETVSSGSPEADNSSQMPLSQQFSFLGYKGITTGMLGVYETLNASIAIKTCLVIRDRSGMDDSGRWLRFDITDDAVMAGIRKAVWPGRFQVVRADIPVIVDGAHNPDGVRALRESAERYLHGRRIILMMAVFADKDYESMLRIMSAISDSIVCFRPGSPRGLAEDLLAESAAKYFKNVYTEHSCSAAVRRTCGTAEAEDAAVIQFGTLSVIAETEKIWKNIR